MFVKDKVAIVTGGVSGIGLGCVKELLKNGLKGVTLADIDSVKGEEVVKELSKQFGAGKVIFVKTDTSSMKEFKNAFNKTVENFKQLDIVMNNAGIANEKHWEKMLGINLNGVINGCILGIEEFLPKYRSGEEGLIINTASVLGLQALPFLPVYSASKAAVASLSRSYGHPLQYNQKKVRVLTLCPGLTTTPIMDDLSDKVFSARYKEFEQNLQESLPLQPLEALTRNFIQLIERGSNGSVWVIELGELYEVELPERLALKKK